MTVDLRVLICDDEPGMRLILARLVEAAEGFIVCGQAGDGEEALRLFDEHKPHVVFLDVEMPKVDGVECARRMQDADPKAALIFATAHEDYMSDAFSVYAYDYLVKPFKADRVLETLRRLQGIRERETPVFTPPGEDQKPLSPKRLMLKNREGVQVVDMADILLVQRENRATVLYTAEGAYTTPETLSQIEARLDPELFFRCHKSYIINLLAIDNITPYGRWTYVVRLRKTKRDALITHEKFEQLQKLFA